MKNLRCFLVYIVLSSISCGPNENLPVIPSVTYLGLSKKTMIQGDLNQDSVWLKFHIVDGDGDISFGSTDSRKDIFLKDSRLPNSMDSYKFPDLPVETGNSIEADVQILVLTTCCIFPNQIPPCSSPVQYPLDSLTYELYVKDKAGNESNHIFSDQLKLICN